MKKIVLLMAAASSIVFSVNLFDFNTDKKEISNEKITTLLKKEVKEKELYNTRYKIVDTEKYKTTETHNTDLYGEIKIENNHNKLSSLTYKLKKNVWYFIKTNEEGMFHFFEYTSSSDDLFSKNNFYIKLLEKQTNILFKTKYKFEPISINDNERLKFIIMGDDLKQKIFSITRTQKGGHNEK